MSTSRGSLVCMVVLLGGCASSLPRVTSGQIGCAEEEIVITDDRPGWSTHTWTARCKDRTYYCSSIGGGDSAPQVSCKQGEAAPAAAPAATTGGCQYDTQCKGERICQQGSCVEPAPTESTPEPTAPAPTPAPAPAPATAPTPAPTAAPRG